MTPSHTTKSGSKRYRYYVCLNAQKRGWRTCKTKSVPAPEIEKFVVDKIRQVCQDSQLVDDVVEQARLQSERDLESLLCEREGLEKEMARWNEAIQAAVPNLKTHDQTSDVLLQLVYFHENLHQAELRLREVSTKLEEMRAVEVTRERVVEAFSRFGPVWESLTLREQTRMVQLIVQQVEYDGATGRVTITFYPDGIKSLALNGCSQLEEVAP